MIYHYICRDVSPESKSSYPKGRTLLDCEVYADEGKARERCARYNECANSPYIRYVVVPADDREPFDFSAVEFRPHPLKSEARSNEQTRTASN